MELPFLVLLGGVTVFVFWLGEQTSSSKRLALKMFCFIMLLILGILVANEGFSNTTGVTASVNQTICATVTNCTNGVNSTCSASNSCSYSYSNTGQFTIVKFDIFTQAFSYLLFILALYVLIVEGLRFMDEARGRDSDE